MPSHHPDSGEITSLSVRHLQKSWIDVEATIEKAKTCKKWQPKDLEKLPSYVPGLPLRIDTFTTSDLDVNQPAHALTLFNQCYKGDRHNNPLPFIQPFSLDFQGQEQLFTLLPKYLATNTAIILKSAYDATDNPEQKQHLLETAKTIDKYCNLLKRKGEQIRTCLVQAKKMNENHQNNKFNTQYRKLQLLHGKIDDEPIVTGSYFDLLDLLAPHMKTLEKSHKLHRPNITELSRKLINQLKPTHSNFPAILTIAIIATTIASAIVTATQCDTTSKSGNQTE